MIKCKPERNPKQALLLVAICAVVFLAVGFFASKAEQYRWISQAISLIAVTVGIFAVYRYTMVEMIYSIGDGSFTVVKKVGNSETVACSLDISTSKCLVTKKQFQEDEKNKVYVTVKNMNFNQNLRPAISYVYVTEFNGKLYSIEFEPNAPFVEAFLNEIDNARKNSGE